MFVSANGPAVVKNLTGSHSLPEDSDNNPFIHEHVEEPAFIPSLHFLIIKSVFNGIFYYHLQSINALL